MSLTPVDIEQRLIQLITQLTKAQGHLSETRDLETEAEIALKRARIAWAADESCPRPARGSVTIAQREAWIDAKVEAEWEQHRRFVTQREIAVDALRTTREIASVVQTLARSVQQAYSMSGQHS